MGGVLLIDNDQDLIEIVGDLIPVVSGKPCLALRGLGQLMSAGERALACELAILDINLGPGNPTGIDVHSWLRGQRFAGRVVFLTGHGQEDALVRRACTLGQAQVFRKPIGLAELRAIVKGEPLRSMLLPPT